MIQENQTIIARNCKIPVVNSHMRMIVDAFGKIEVSKHNKVIEVNKEKDLSSMVYDNFSSKSNYRGNDRASKINDGSSMNTYGTEYY
jgi:hypothetical protein